MTIAIISKALVIKAIEEEPLKTLRPGSWVEVSPWATHPPKVKDPTCRVCAVGAVMRNVLSAAVHAKDMTTVIGFNLPDDVACRPPSGMAEKDALAYVLPTVKEFPLQALSFYFENQCFIRDFNNDDISRNRDMKAIRNACIKFVKKYFPNKIEINVCNFNLGKGIRRKS